MHRVRRPSIVLLNSFREGIALKSSCHITEVRLLQITSNPFIETPWYGGFWERLISQVKRCLKKTLGKTTLDFYELQTVL